MNVLLAEVDVPYGDLVEMDDVNRDMPQCDVAPVEGANDVVNPAANRDESSPIYGMPIIEASEARAIFSIEQSRKPGFAGIDNTLYFDDKTWMQFGDARHVVGELIIQRPLRRSGSRRCVPRVHPLRTHRRCGALV